MSTRGVTAPRSPRSCGHGCATPPAVCSPSATTATCSTPSPATSSTPCTAAAAGPTATTREWGWGGRAGLRDGGAPSRFGLCAPSSVSAFLEQPGSAAPSLRGPCRRPPFCGAPSRCPTRAFHGTRRRAVASHPEAPRLTSRRVAAPWSSAGRAA